VRKSCPGMTSFGIINTVLLVIVAACLMRIIYICHDGEKQQLGNSPSLGAAHFSR
jgi:hypothetical protein